MKQIFTAATVDEAKNKAAVEFGTEVEKITFTVLEEPKKGFFGRKQEKPEHRNLAKRIAIRSNH